MEGIFLLVGRVYNITPYMDYHPGGETELMRCAGIDGTLLFNEVSLELMDVLLYLPFFII